MKSRLQLSKVISTSGLVAAILNFASRPTSDNVDSVISESGMAENMGVEVGIAMPSLPVEKLFRLPVSVAAILNSVGG